MATKKPAASGGLVEFIRALRDEGVSEYEGPGPQGQTVKLVLGAAPPARTGKAITPSPARPPNPVPKELEEAGIDAETLAEAQARAAALFQA